MCLTHQTHRSKLPIIYYCAQLKEGGRPPPLGSSHHLIFARKPTLPMISIDRFLMTMMDVIFFFFGSMVF